MSHAYAENLLRPEAQIEYIKRLDVLLPKLEGIPNHARYFLLTQFNMAYANPNFYSDPRIQDISHSAMETNRPIGKGQGIIEDVLRFLMTTEVHTQTGLSFLDIMSLDPYTYSIIKKIYTEVEEPKREAMRKLQDNLGNNQKSLQNMHKNMQHKPPMKGYRNAHTGKK